MGILGQHLEDEITYFPADLFPAEPSFVPGKPFPIQAKAGAVPADYGFRCDHKQCVSPSGPEPSRQDPEELVGGGQSRAAILGFEHRELLSQHQVFQHQVAAGVKQAKISCGSEFRFSHVTFRAGIASETPSGGTQM